MKCHGNSYSACTLSYFHFPLTPVADPGGVATPPPPWAAPPPQKKKKKKRKKKRKKKERTLDEKPYIQVQIL